MNPFFIFLFICAIIALVYWFKNASSKQGILALKGFLILIALILIILVVTGRLPIMAGIPILLAGLFRKFALKSLLIPLIKMMAGSYFTTPKASTIVMDKETALDTLKLKENPTREQIVQAHRKLLRDLREGSHYSQNDVEKLDSARAFLIENCID